MAVIEFKEKVAEMMEQEDVSLATFKLTERDVNVKELYSYINRKSKVKIVGEYSGIEEWGISSLSIYDLFKELTRVASEYDSERVAWIVLDRKMDYLYIKEKDIIYKSEKGKFEHEIKICLYGYGIDYLMLLQRISSDVYRWVSF